MSDDLKEAGGDAPPAVAEALAAWERAQAAAKEATKAAREVAEAAKKVIEANFPHPIGTVFVDEAGKKFVLLKYDGYWGWDWPSWPPRPVLAAEKKGGGFMQRPYRRDSWRAKHAEAPKGKLTLFKE